MALPPSQSRRLELHALLKGISGVANAYFQPPTSDEIVYPCIVYERSDVDKVFANNNPYRQVRRYQLTVIDTDPDSLIPDLVSNLPLCSHERNYTADNLHHYIFNLYY